MTTTHRVEEARLTIHVSPEVMADATAFEAVKAVHGERLTEMFAHTTTDVQWSEPEPQWYVGDETEGHLVGRFFAGEYAETREPDLYFMFASQRGVRRFADAETI